MGAPLQYRGGSVYRVDNRSHGAFAMTSRLASIQVFDQADQNRTVVLASTSENWSLMDRLFTALGNTAPGWSALSGDVVAIGPKGSLVNLTVKSGGTPEFTAAAHSKTSLYAAIGVLFALILLGLAIWAVLRYRRRSADAADDAARRDGPSDGDADLMGNASTGREAGAGPSGTAANDDG
jgi:flagellar biosynthesis/type III secretory pathway M-ring protein FliF/YscJ